MTDEIMDNYYKKDDWEPKDIKTILKNIEKFLSTPAKRDSMDVDWKDRDFDEKDFEEFDVLIHAIMDTKWDGGYKFRERLIDVKLTNLKTHEKPPRIAPLVRMDMNDYMCPEKYLDDPKYIENHNKYLSSLISEMKRASDEFQNLFYTKRSLEHSKKDKK